MKYYLICETPGDEAGLATDTQGMADWLIAEKGFRLCTRDEYYTMADYIHNNIEQSQMTARWKRKFGNPAREG